MSRWTEEEVEYLKRNYSNTRANKIGEMLNRTTGAVRAKAKRLHIKSGFLFEQPSPPNFLCRKCKKVLVKDENWNSYEYNRRNYICKECGNEYQREKYESDKYKRRTRQRQIRLEWKLKAFEVLGNICVKCGLSDWRALQIDHIRGGGGKEIREIKNYSKHYKNIIEMDEKKRDEKYQLLCANCNWIKRRENNEGVGPLK